MQPRVHDGRRAALEDACHSSGLAQVRQVGGLVIEHDRVELVARGNSSKAVPDPAELCSYRGRGQQCLFDAQAGSMQQGELREVAPVIVAMAEVAAERDLDARSPGDLDGLPEVFTDLDGPRRTVWVKVTGACQRHQPLVDGKGRNEKASASSHGRCVSLGEEDPVLDGAGSGLDCLADGITAERVHHDGEMATAGLEHGNREVLERELRVEAAIGCRQHASRGNELDPIGS